MFGNLASGFCEAVQWGELVVGDLLDAAALAYLQSHPGAHVLLGWTPEFTDLEAIVETAWRWECTPRYGR